MMRAHSILFIASLLLILPLAVHAQGTYTAASCNESDVNAVINGPTHSAVNGDTIQIPAGSCTWTTGITITGVGIDITGTGTPNNGSGTVGAGTPNTTLVDNANGPLFVFNGLIYGQTAKVELLTMSASGAGANSIRGSVAFSGACTSNGCANVRVDNINYTSGTWENALAGGYILVTNVFGVADHNTASESTAASPTLTQIVYNSWQGVGDWGDNSFATADTFGTGQAFYVENNSLSGVRGTDNDVPASGNAGGARYVCRFNTVTNMSGTGVCSAHGTAWGGRFRGQRQVEVYYNTVSGSACNAMIGLISGTGYYFSNAYTSGGCNSSVSLDIARFEETGEPWNSCNGTQPWDQSPFTSASQCLDQPGHGPGLLLQGGSDSSQAGMILMSNPGVSCSGASVGTCWPNPALDPVYEAGETVAGGTPGFGWVAVANDGSSTRILANRDFYAEVSQSAQSSQTSPFNGTSGTGYGTLANRPTTCTPYVGYWATDQGTWNTSGSGGQGELFICTATNTWTLSYTPYTYPHPLTTGGTSVGNSPTPAPPTSLTATVQ